jgi:hypothetical protein
VTSVKKEAKQKDEAIIMSKRKSLNLVRIEGSDRQLPISRYPDQELKFNRINDVFKG